MRKSIAAIVTLSALSLVSGCDALPPEAEGPLLGFQKSVKAWYANVTGRNPQPLPTATASASPSELHAQRARDAKVNAELLHEVFKVVYMREPTDRSIFGSLVDSLNQGASLEGMYNGFTHSAEYRKVEMANSGASPEALQMFARELVVLEQELPNPVEFDASAIQPLALPVDPAVEPPPPPSPAKSRADGVNVIEYGKPAPAASGSLQREPKVLIEKYGQQFVGASIFTLKRILGDEGLKVVASKRQYPEKLALWYGRWVQHMASLGVDFGISQRNKPDEEFHYKWAMTASEDRLNWEVLNRLHRVLNESNRSKQ